MTTFETEMKKAIAELVEMGVGVQYHGPDKLLLRIDPVLGFAVLWGGPLVRCWRYEAVLAEIEASEAKMGLTVEQVQWIRHKQTDVMGGLGVKTLYCPVAGLPWRCGRCNAWHVRPGDIENQALLEACGFTTFEAYGQYPCKCGWSLTSNRQYDDDERDQT